MSSWLLPSLCLLDTLLTPIYVLLTLIVLSSLVVPFLQDLASHGKTRYAATATGSAPTQQRHGYESSAAFLPSLMRRLSHGDEFLIQKRFFLHFYICGLLSLAVVFYFSASFPDPTMDRNPSVRNMTTLSLLGIHLTRRLYECLHVHRTTSQSKMHLAGYLLGVLHYLLLPIVFVPLPCDHGREATVSSHELRESKVSLVIRTAASLFCLWAQCQQYWHHCLLAKLRLPNTSTSNAKTVYRLPVGGWFRFVTCPHYLAEILIYLAFAILLEMQKEHSAHNRFRHFVLLGWVAINLTVSALSNHQWYTEHIPNHTQLGRKAIVPLLL